MTRRRLIATDARPATLLVRLMVGAGAWSLDAVLSRRAAPATPPVADAP